MTARLHDRFSYADVVKHYDIRLCSDYATCSRRVSQKKHRYGGADSMGVHLQDAGTRPVTRQGLRNVLRACAEVRLRHHRSPLKPVWLQLYEKDVWAYREAYDTWHVRLLSEWSDKDRQRVLKLTRDIQLRTDHVAVYRWATTPFYRRNSHG
jgi:hypothetical protein